MPYTFVNPAPVLFDLTGTDPISGGSITFYDKGTTDLRDTWSDEDLTVLNPNPVDLDSAGRINTEVWMDGDYSVVIKAADGTVVATKDMTSGNTAGATIPALENGKWLTNNGVALIWDEIRQVPDPTGSANKILGTDGANLIWQALPEPPEPPAPFIEITGDSQAGSILFGTTDSTTKYYRRWGQASAPANPSQKTTQVNITFSPPFAQTPVVTANIIGVTITQNGAYLGDVSVSGLSAAGATLNVNTNHGEANSDGNIPSNVALNWSAEGIRVVA